MVGRLAALLAFFTCTAAVADELKTPDIVNVESVRVSDGIKSVTVGNSKGRYALTCNLEAAGCISPSPGHSYYVFDKSTHWKMPGAKEVIGLSFVQDWTVTYKGTENIALVPIDSGGPGELGMYILGRWTAK